MALDKQPPLDPAALDALVGKAVGELADGYGGVMIDIGNKLGLYKAMAGAGPVTSQELARAAGCAERYVREWLNAQAAGGYVAYHRESGTYELTPEQAFVLADERSPVFMPPIWEVVAAAWADEAKTLEAFRSGKGVSWGEHDGRLHCGAAAFYRNGYRASLVPEWLPALDGVIAKLEAGARVADVGCGHGHPSLLMAEAFPRSRFFGFDTHKGSIEAAQAHAREAGLSGRVSFAQADAKEPLPGPFDLVCFFDCLHDLGHPVEAAQRAREASAQDGALMLVEPYAADRVEDNLNTVGRIYYTGSTWLCCAHAISEEGTHVLGAQAGRGAAGAGLPRGGLHPRPPGGADALQPDPRSAALTVATKGTSFAPSDPARLTPAGAARPPHAGRGRASPSTRRHARHFPSPARPRKAARQLE